jgi:hypothetical protein
LLSLGAGFVVGGIAAVRRFREADAAHGGPSADRPVAVG